MTMPWSLGVPGGAGTITSLLLVSPAGVGTLTIWSLDAEPIGLPEASQGRISGSVRVEPGAF